MLHGIIRNRDDRQFYDGESEYTQQLTFIINIEGLFSVHNTHIGGGGTIYQLEGYS